MEKKQLLKKALALSWARRALNSTTQASFYNCMSVVKGILPYKESETLNKVSDEWRVPLEKWIIKVEKELPSEILALTGSDSSSIYRLERLLDDTSHDNSLNPFSNF